MNLYQITYNSDRTEGRGGKLFLNLYFTKFQDALTFVKSDYYANTYGVWGTPGSEFDIKTVDSESLEPNIYESIAEYESETGDLIVVDETIVRSRELMKLSKNDLVKMIIEKEQK